MLWENAARGHGVCVCHAVKPFSCCFGDFVVKRLLFLLCRSSNGKDYCKHLLYEDKGGVVTNDKVHVSQIFMFSDKLLFLTNGYIRMYFMWTFTLNEMRVFTENAMFCACGAQNCSC